MLQKVFQNIGPVYTPIRKVGAFQVVQILGNSFSFSYSDSCVGVYHPGFKLTLPWWVMMPSYSFFIIHVVNKYIYLGNKCICLLTTWIPSFVKYILSLFTSFKKINFQDSIYALNIGPSLEMYSKQSCIFHNVGGVFWKANHFH